MKPIIHTLVGQKFGRLTAIAVDQNRKGNLICVCECGPELSVQLGNLRSGNTTSCGCLRNERLRASTTTHGKYHTPERRIWAGMLSRCDNPNVKGYPGYGGRGITVCERWRQDFLNFLADMGERPSDEHSIDRFPDQQGNYEPGNCRWATRKQQAQNRKSSVMVTFNGKTQTMRDWEDEFGLVRGMLYYRLRVAGWSIEEALTTPARRPGRETYDAIAAGQAVPA